MENYDYEESNMCRFNSCPYYDFENEKCSLNICKKLNKKHHEKR